MVQKFDRVENTEYEPIKLHISIENRSGTGVHVRLHEAGKYVKGGYMPQTSAEKFGMLGLETVEE